MNATYSEVGPAFRHAVAEQVRSHLARQRVSCRQLAARLQISPSKLQRRLNGTVALDVDDIATIAAALNTSPYQLMFGATGELHSFPTARLEGAA